MDFDIVAGVAKGIEITIQDTAAKTESVHRFPKLPVRIGRNELNDLHLELGFVSQFHAVLEEGDGQIMLRDLGSTNGSIVNGAKLTSASTALGSDAGVFAILTLLLRVRRVSASQIAPPASKKKAMNVTGLLKGPPPELLEALIKSKSRPSAPQEEEKLDRLYAGYRTAWNELREAIQEASLNRPEDDRGPYFTGLSNKYPGVTSEPDFHRMAGEAGARSLSMRDPEQEKSIALEGLKELFGEYVPGAVPPESPDELVKLLTRIRGVLDVFFKAFLPLRDGQRQFERELGIQSNSPQSHPVEQADTPKKLSAILLSLDPSAEESAAVVESALADIMIHHVAMLNGVMRGVGNILAEISPDAVKSYASQLLERGTLSKGFGGAHKMLWQAFERKHSDLNGEERQLFGLLFGRQFSQAYQEAAGPSGGTRNTLSPNR